jgi:cyclohexanecarboxylate-CoA ligase
VIVPKDPPIPSVSELRAFLKTLGVAAFKIPEEVFAMDSLPKNAAGKTLRHEIRALLLREAQQKMTRTPIAAE